MAITFTTSYVVETTGNNRTSDALTLGFTPTSGQLLVLCEGWKNTVGVTSITGGGVTTWAKAISKAHSSASRYSGIWYGIVDTTPSTSVTPAFAKTSVAAEYRVLEFAGTVTTSIVDKTATNEGSSTSPDTGTTATTTNAGDVAVGVVFDGGGVTTGTQTNSFVEISATNNCGAAYKIETTTVAANTGWTGGSDTWTGCIATFFPASNFSRFFNFFPLGH